MTSCGGKGLARKALPPVASLKALPPHDATWRGAVATTRRAAHEAEGRAEAARPCWVPARPLPMRECMGASTHSHLRVGARSGRDELGEAAREGRGVVGLFGCVSLLPMAYLGAQNSLSGSSVRKYSTAGVPGWRERQPTHQYERAACSVTRRGPGPAPRRGPARRRPHARTPTPTHVYARVHARTHARTHTCLCACARIHARTNARTHTSWHVHTHIRTHTRSHVQ
jgi:hypothetical protein